MKRYDAELGGFGDLKIVERPKGDWVKWDDVERLEESHKELLGATKALVNWWETLDIPREYRESFWTMANKINQLRAAIAKAEGSK